MLKLKILILLQALFFSNFKLSAQFFGLLQKNPQNYYGTLLKYPKDNKYRVLNVRYDNAIGLNTEIQILIYNQNFALVDSVNMPQFHNYSGRGPIYSQNKIIWAGAEYSPRSINNWQTHTKNYVFIFDSLYHLQNKILLSVDSNCLGQMISEFYGGYIVSQLIYDFTAGNSLIKLYKLNRSFQKTDSTKFVGLLNQTTVLNNKIQIIGNNLPLPCTPNSPNDPSQRKLELDTNLNLIGCFNYLNFDSQKITGSALNSNSLFFDTNPQAFILPLSKTRYFILGTTNQLYNSQRLSAQFIVNSIFDHVNNHIKSKIISDTALDVCNYNESMEVDFNAEYIISIGNKGYNSKIYNAINNNKNNFTVHKMDTLGNTIWLKEFGGEMHYAAKSILFTNDNGCLISGLRYDSASAVNVGMTNIGQSFLLKLDANGNYNALGLTENGKNVSNQIKCFPNPAQQTLFFDVPFQENIDVEIFDLLGRRVLRKENYKNYTAINIEGLAQGAYLYQIKTKTNFYSGKFLKTSD